MKTSNKIIIDKPADDIWRVVADEFAQNDKWMSSVFRTADQKDSGNSELGGRVCELTPTFDGLQTYEPITSYDKDNYTLKFDVFIRNGGRLPVNSNKATITLTKLGDNKTEVEWATTPDLKPLGYLLAPVLKKGLQKTFGEVLEELKYYVETGKQHPRKVEAMKQVKS